MLFRSTFVDFRRGAGDGGPLALTITNNLEFIVDIVAMTFNAMKGFGLMDRATLSFCMTIYPPRPNMFINANDTLYKFKRVWRSSGGFSRVVSKDINVAILMDAKAEDEYDSGTILGSNLLDEASIALHASISYLEEAPQFQKEDEKNVTLR